MGMLDLFRNWLDHKRGQFRPRTRLGYTGIELLEARRVLSPVLMGTTLKIDGTAGADTISVTQDSNGVKVIQNGVETTYDSSTTINTINVLGHGNDDQITINSVFESTTLTVDGGTGNDTLISPITANNWQVTGPNSGTLNGKAFSNVENLVGSGQIDNFRFGPAGFVSGNVEGGGGINTLDYSSRTAGVLVDIGTGKGTAIGGQFSNMTNFLGSSDNTDSLTGSNTANAWQITSGNAGNINLQNFFSGFETLKGGSDVDTFSFSPTGFVSRNVIGGGGANTIDYSARSIGVVTNLQANTSTAIGGTFSQINSLIGTSGSDNLTGINNTNVWKIEGQNSGKVESVFTTTNFTGYENLIGGTVSDTFKFSAAGFVSGSINGGLGLNTLDYSGRTESIVVNLQTNSATAVGGGFLLIQNLVGSSGATPSAFDTLIGTNLATDWSITSGNTGNLNGTFFFSSIENLSGGIANDTYRFLPVGFVSGVVNAGLGTNTLDYSSRNNGIVVGLQSTLNTNVNVYTSPASAIGGGYAYISNLIGTSDNDMLTGANSTTTTNVWTIMDRNTGNVNGNFNFTGIENLKGGTGVDIFRMMDQNSLITGTIDGNFGGFNWLDYGSYLTQVTVNLSNGVATNIGNVTNVMNVRGGHATNHLTGNSRGNVLLGGESADTIVAGPGRSLLIGGAGADTVTGYSADDIVIGSFTVYDHDLAALSTIIAEWQSADTFEQRVSKLRSGVGQNGSIRLVADATVLNDAAPDVISGGASKNWLWGQPAEFADLTAQDIYDTPINNPPILTVSSVLSYAPLQSATAVNTAITITDIDSTTLVSATVRIGNNYIAGQDALGFVPSNATGNITGSFNATTGVLTLVSQNGSATLAQFQAALRSVAYWNASATPVTSPRTIVYQVFDGIAYSNSVSSTVFFNSPPVIAGSSVINYTAGQGPTPINTGITVSDANNVNLMSATVKLSNIFFAGQDFLEFVGNASTGNITGNYNPVTGVMTLSAGPGGATVANFQSALRLVTYRNLSLTPSLFNRTVTFQVSDGNALSNTVNSTIIVS
ncbi:beta strand repeat-containing protein [Schlesneria sp. T3-172]|uniref:beta strand repeat-containing protein n=1 Tax=Schlesneria sphaerica TaxID=3373610 RepID=UPI0037C70713